MKVSGKVFVNSVEPESTTKNGKKILTGIVINSYEKDMSGRPKLFYKLRTTNVKRDSYLSKLKKNDLIHFSNGEFATIGSKKVGENGAVATYGCIDISVADVSIQPESYFSDDIVDSVTTAVESTKTEKNVQKGDSSITEKDFSQISASKEAKIFEGEYINYNFPDIANERHG